jgi:endonuclease/exonuclease/phosphatase family metal-dependent hydrolase
MKLFLKFILWTNIIAAISLLLCYLVPHFDPHDVWYFSFLGLLYPIIVIINICFISFWLFKDLRYTLISLISILIGFNYIGNYFAINASKTNQNSRSISIISFNIGNAIEAYDKKKDIKISKQQKMSDFLERFKDEDIICLQEIGTYADEIINKNFEDYNIHKFNKGAVILTKHKMIKKGQINFGTRTNSCLWSDIAIDTDTLRIYSIHLQSNRITNDANAVIESKDIKDKTTWNRFKRILRRYKNYHQDRVLQAKAIKEHADLSPYPVLLCGDFNDVPMSYTYSLLQKNLKDAYSEAGNGTGSTFNGKIPLLRIDYILHDEKLQTNKFNIIRENYSDHYPIAVLLSL